MWRTCLCNMQFKQVALLITSLSVVPVMDKEFQFLHFINKNGVEMNVVSDREIVLAPHLQDFSAF